MIQMRWNKGDGNSTPILEISEGAGWVHYKKSKEYSLAKDEEGPVGRWGGFRLFQHYLAKRKQGIEVVVLGQDGRPI